MESRHSRREFLKNLNLLLALGAGSTLSEFLFDCNSAVAKNPKVDSLLLSANGHRYKVMPWTGDNFTRGHELRNGDIPKFPEHAEATYDFVIVGGGIAGLTSAYYLKDHNYLLLEQYDELGGNSRGSSYRGIDFSYGPAYVGDLEGLAGKLFEEIGLTGYKLLPPRNAWYVKGEWLPGVDGNKQHILYKEFDRFFSEAKPLWQQMGEWQGSMPNLESDLGRLDAVPFSSVLTSYDPLFVEMIDRFCKSTLCGSVSGLSALAGYMLLQDPRGIAHVFKGGNPAIANALKAKLNAVNSPRNKTGCFVWNVTAKEDGASVVYQDSQGVMHKVNCRKVINCAPPLVSARITTGMSDTTKALLLSFKYGAYLVANFCMKKKVFNGSYDNWVGAPFTFTDVITAETPYIDSNSYKPSMGSVLTMYHPWTPGSEGRGLLFEGDRERFSTDLVEQMHKLVPQFDANLEKVVLSRWGHAMVVARPGFFKLVQKLQAEKTGSYILAHNSMHGLPCAESAIGAARHAADVALGIKE